MYRVVDVTIPFDVRRHTLHPELQHPLGLALKDATGSDMHGCLATVTGICNCSEAYFSLTGLKPDRECKLGRESQHTELQDLAVSVGIIRINDLNVCNENSETVRNYILHVYGNLNTIDITFRLRIKEAQEEHERMQIVENEPNRTGRKRFTYKHKFAYSPTPSKGRRGRKSRNTRKYRNGW